MVVPRGGKHQRAARRWLMLAERALPGSFIVDQTGRRFVNEATDYMSFGQRVLEREKAGDPAESMWFVFDQEYRNSYVFAGGIFPRQPLPQAFFDSGIAHKASSPVELCPQGRSSRGGFCRVLREVQRGRLLPVAMRNLVAAEVHNDRYYGDPTVSPNPNLRKLDTSALYAVKMTLSDLGTCGVCAGRTSMHACFVRTAA